MKGVTLLGATGSIGASALAVISMHRDRYRVVALTANRQVEQLYAQCLTHRPEYAVMADPDAAEQLRHKLNQASADIQVLAGSSGLCQVASLAQTDYVLAGIVGAVGLKPTLAAARAGKRILLANKEA